MTAALHIRDIGEDRKSALTEEARRRGLSVADLVRACIDETLDRARREREKQAWIEAARPGLQAEAERIRTHGMELAEYRSVIARPE